MYTCRTAVQQLHMLLALTMPCYLLLSSVGKADGEVRGLEQC
jgi:hypothetical protein